MGNEPKFMKIHKTKTQAELTVKINIYYNLITIIAYN